MTDAIRDDLALKILPADLSAEERQALAPALAEARALFDRAARDKHFRRPAAIEVLRAMFGLAVRVRRGERVIAAPSRPEPLPTAGQAQALKRACLQIATLSKVRPEWIARTLVQAAHEAEDFAKWRRLIQSDAITISGRWVAPPGPGKGEAFIVDAVLAILARVAHLAERPSPLPVNKRQGRDSDPASILVGLLGGCGWAEVEYPRERLAHLWEGRADLRARALDNNVAHFDTGDKALAKEWHERMAARSKEQVAADDNARLVAMNAAEKEMRGAEKRSAPLIAALVAFALGKPRTAAWVLKTQATRRDRDAVRIAREKGAHKS